MPKSKRGVNEVVTSDGSLTRCLIRCQQLLRSWGDSLADKRGGLREGSGLRLRDPEVKSRANGVIAALWGAWLILVPRNILRNRFRRFIVRSVYRVLIRCAWSRGEPLVSELKKVSSSARRFGCLGASKSSCGKTFHRWIPRRMLTCGKSRYGSITRALSAVSYLGRALPPGGPSKVRKSLEDHESGLTAPPMNFAQRDINKVREVICSWARRFKPSFPRTLDLAYTYGASLRTSRRLGGHAGERAGLIRRTPFSGLNDTEMESEEQVPLFDLSIQEFRVVDEEEDEKISEDGRDRKSVV